MYVSKGTKSLWHSYQAITGLFGLCLCWLQPLSTVRLHQQSQTWLIYTRTVSGRLFSAGSCGLVVNDCTFSVPCSHLPGCVSRVVHHVCVVVLENYLYKTSNPFQRGTVGIQQTVLFVVTYHIADNPGIMNKCTQYLFVSMEWVFLYVSFYTLLLFKWNMLLVCHTASWLICIVP